ncbi:hypothetical protein D3C71_1377020 [compost metagenome]
MKLRGPFRERLHAALHLKRAVCQLSQVGFQRINAGFKLAGAAAELARPVTGLIQSAGDLLYLLQHAAGIRFGKLRREIGLHLFNRVCADLSGYIVVIPVRLIHNLRLLGVIRHQRRRLLREILRNRNRHIIVVALDSFLRLFCGHERPFEAVALLKLLYQILADLQCRSFVIGSGIQIDDGDRELIQLPVRVPGSFDHNSAV